MSLLEIVQNVAAESGYDVDSSRVVDSTDLTTKQLHSIANRIIGEMARRFDWPQLWKSTSFTLVDGQGTYALPEDYSRYHADTFWNQSQRWKLRGPISPEEYAAIRGFEDTARISDVFAVRGTTDNNILIDPTPDSGNAGEIIIYEYTAARPVRPQFHSAGATVAEGDFCFWNGNYYESEGSGQMGSTPPTHTTGTANDGIIDWTYYDGDYDRFYFDTDEPIFQQPVLELGVLERFASIKGLQSVEKMFDRQLEEEYARSRPGREFSLVQPGRSTTVYAANNRVNFSRG